MNRPQEDRRIYFFSFARSIRHEKLSNEEAMVDFELDPRHFSFQGLLMSSSIQGKPDLERYRKYLKVLADIQLNPKIRVKEDASDIVQWTLVQAHQDLDGFRGKTEQELRAWLKTILIHTTINLAKKYGAQKRDFRLERSIDQQLQESAIRIAGELPADQTTPSQQLMRQERAEQLADAMSDLLDDEYTAVMLKHIHAWKVAEIAAHLGRSPEAVAGLLRRGLRKLRDKMQESDVDG